MITLARMATDVPQAAADVRSDALFVARAALKLATKQRRDADAQVDHLRQLIQRLERRDPSPETY